MIQIKPEDILEKKKSIQPIQKYNKDAYIIPLHTVRFPNSILDKNDRADMFTDMISVLFKKKDGKVQLLFMPQELVAKGKLLSISLTLSDKALNKLKASIAKLKQVKLPIHYLYALALMWWYADWADTAEYDACIKQMLQLQLDKKFVSVHKLPLYRALTISPEGRKRLAQGKTIELKPRLGTSWSTGKRRPLFVARYYKAQTIEETRRQAEEENKPVSEIKRIPQPKIIILTIKKAAPVVMNAYILRQSNEFKIFSSLVTNHYRSLYRFLLDEIILKGNGGYSKIKLKHLA